MFNESVSVDFNANMGPFSASITQAIDQLEALGRASGGGIASLNKLNNVSLSIIKHMTGFAGATKTATEQAAAYQQKLSGISALTAAAGKQFEGLDKTTMKFARQFPVGMDKAIETTKALATSGVTSTKEIDKLGKTFIKLQAATGEWGAGMTQDMLQVTRTFGNSNQQIGALSDSLVTVTTKFGASASSVLSFSKAIAPVSAAVGLSQTSVFGLSTAFSKLGEDGYRSANAFSKVLLDLGRSVRTGSPEIRTYADVLGMTQSSLTELMNTDPSAVIVKFAKTINSQGTDAIHTLDRLGLDGVQTFKSIQALSNSGDLQKMLDTSNQAYGNNKTTDAAKEALGGVNDKLTTLGETMTQTVSAAGTPFLGMLEKLLGVANSFASVIFKIVDSPLGKFFSVAAAGAGALLASMKVLSLYSFAKLGINKFGESNMAETFRQGRKAGADGEAISWTSKDGPLYKLGQIIGGGFGNKKDGKEPGIIAENGGGIKGIFETLKNMVVWGATAATNIQTNTLQMTPNQMDNRQRTQAGMNLSNRLTLARAGMDINLDKDATAVAKAASGDHASFTTQIKGSIKALQSFGKEIGAGDGKFKELGTAAKELGKNFAKSAGHLTVDVAKGLGTGIKGLATGLAETVGPQAIAVGAITAGMKVYDSWQAHKEARKALWDATNTDANAQYNAFAEKAGLKTLGKLSLPEQTQKTTNEIAAQNKTVAEALKLTSEELGQTKLSNYQSSFSVQNKASTQSTAEAMRLTLGLNADPMALARMLMDVANQKGDSYAKEVADKYKKTGTTEKDKAVTYDKAIKSIQSSEGWWQRNFGAWVGDKASTAELKTGLGDEWTRNINAKTRVYGTSTNVVNAANIQEANAAFKALQTNDTTTTEGIVQDLLKTKLGLSGDATKNVFGYMKNEETGKSRNIVEALQEYKKFQITNYGKTDSNKKDLEIIDSFIKTYNAGGKNIDKFNFAQLSGRVRSIQDQNVVDVRNNISRYKGTQDVVRSSDVAENSLFGGEHLAWKLGKLTTDLTDADMKQLSATQKAFVALEKAPNDLAKQMDAGNKYLADQYKALGNHFGAISGGILTKLSGLDSTDSKYAALMNAYQTNQLRQQTEQSGQTFLEKGATAKSGGIAARALGPQANANTEQVRQTQLQEEQNFYSQSLSFTKQFLEAKANLDYQVQIQEKHYRINVFRSNRDFNLQIKYQDEDFALQRKRAAEDFAKSVYSPFQRIAAVRTTDAYSLIGNLRQQSKTLREQMKNVGILNKKFKLSKETIAMLDLMNPANAQEVARLVMDFSNNPNLATQVEAEANTRQSLSKDYINSDYNQQQVRIFEDFSKNQKRMKNAHKVSLADMLADLKTSITESYAELARFGTEVSVPASQIASKLKGAFKDMPAEAQKQLSATLKALSQGFANYVPAIQQPQISANTSFGNNIAGYAGNTVNKMNDQSGTVTNIDGTVVKVGVNAPSVIKAKNRPKAAYEQKKKHGQKAAAALNLQGSLYQYGNPNNFDESGILNAIGVPGTASQLKSQAKKISASKADQGDLVFFTSTDGKLGVAMLVTPNIAIAAPQWGAAIIAEPVQNFPGTKTFGALQFAKGGHVQGPGTSTSDSIPAHLSHGEYVIKADAVKQYGTHFFDQLNAQRYAKVNYLNASEVKSNGMRHYGSSVTNTTSTQYDHSTQINGQITVQASDPNEFLRKINAQQRRQRLIQPVGN